MLDVHKIERCVKTFFSLFAWQKKSLTKKLWHSPPIIIFFLSPTLNNSLTSIQNSLLHRVLSWVPKLPCLYLILGAFLLTEHQHDDALLKGQKMVNYLKFYPKSHDNLFIGKLFYGKLCWWNCQINSSKLFRNDVSRMEGCWRELKRDVQFNEIALNKMFFADET